MIDIMKKRRRGEAPVDNYEVFKLRLTNASKGLKERRTSLSGKVITVKQMLTANQAALRNWDAAFDRVHYSQKVYSGGESGRRSLDELVDTAQRMKDLFSKRVAILYEQLSLIESEHAAVVSALAEVEDSTSKIELSKILQEDRTKLMQTEMSLGGFEGTPALPSGEHALPHELQVAREAVAMAEALLELRGH